MENPDKNQSRKIFKKFRIYSIAMAFLGFSNLGGAADQDPGGPEEGVFKVLRGGSKISDPEECRPAQRYGRIKNIRYPLVGFRLVILP